MGETQAITLDFNDHQFDELSITKDQPWGRLISLNPHYPNQELTGDELVMGRQSVCSLRFEDKMISGRHCRIYKDKPDKNSNTAFHQPADSLQLIFLEDLSTNGTYVNGNKVGKGNCILLTNNAEIMLVPRRENSEPVVYVYQDANNSNKQQGKQDEIYNKYDIRETLGTGNFAAVKLAIHKSSGLKYAVKVIDKKKYMKQAGSRKDALMDEVQILKSLNHPNIIQIKDVFDTEKTLYIVLELVTGGELYDYIVDRGFIPEDKTKQLFIQMVNAVHYLHSHGIVHRDLKPENILLKDKKYEEIAISDFGLSKAAGDNNVFTTVCGTPQYLAPEIILNDHKGYTKVVDCWSLGAILYIMLSGMPPFDENRSMDQVKSISLDYSHDVWQNISDAAKDLINCLLRVDQSKRYDTTMILAHPWITGEDFEPMRKIRLKEAEEESRLAEENSKKKEKEEEARIANEVERRIQEELQKQGSLTLNNNNNSNNNTNNNNSTEEPIDQKKRKREITTAGNEQETKKSGSNIDNNSKQLPLCKYGEQCYRKNPQHFKEFRHPRVEDKGNQ